MAYALLSGEPSVFSARRLIAYRKRIEGFYLGHLIARRRLWRKAMDVRELRRLARAELQTRVESRLPLAVASGAIETYRSRISAGKILLVADPTAIPLSRSQVPATRPP